MQIESLESRRLFTFTITGTSGVDDISLSIVGNRIVSHVNGVEQSTLDSLHSSIVIDALGGADAISIEKSGNNTVDVNAGSGNDAINIGAVNHDLDNVLQEFTVNGGFGTDTLAILDQAHNQNRALSVSADRINGVNFNVEHSALENMTFAMGSASDGLFFEPMPVSGTLAVDTGDDEDFVTVLGPVPSMSVDGGAGGARFEYVGTAARTHVVAFVPSSEEDCVLNLAGVIVPMHNITSLAAANLASLSLGVSAGSDTIFVDPTPNAPTTRISGTAVFGAFAPIDVSFTDLLRLNLDSDEDDDTIDTIIVNSMDPTDIGAIDIDAGDGENNLLLRETNTTLNTRFGPLGGSRIDLTCNESNIQLPGSQEFRDVSMSNSSSLDMTTANATLVVRSLEVFNSDGTLDVDAGQMATVSTSFKINGAGARLIKTGDGTLNVNASQSHVLDGMLDVQNGVVNIATDAGSAASRRLSVKVDEGTINFNATQHLRSLQIETGTVNLAAQGTRVLVTESIDIDTEGGELNLNNNDLIVDYAGASQLAQIAQLLRDGRANGAWIGAGITSNAAKSNSLHNTTLGAIEAADFKSIYGANAMFSNQAIDTTAVLVKYTYYGDADFNGVVNFDDYSRTDAGFNFGRTGWLNGDFDGNGTVNFDDYSLIDLAFNTQGSALRPLARPSTVGTGLRTK